MKRKEGFITHKVGKQNYIVAVGENSKEYHFMLKCNDTGLYIWELLEQDCTVEQLTERMIERFDVDREKAAAGVEKILDILKKNHLLYEE